MKGLEREIKEIIPFTIASKKKKKKRKKKKKKTRTNPT